jgi:5'-3' exonuclease
MAKSFVEFSRSYEDRLLIVDGLNLSFRWKHKGSTNFSDEFINTVKSLAKSYKCSKIIVASDWGSSSYRKNLFPEYKGNREDLRAKQTDQEKNAFKKFFEEYERTLMNVEIEGIPVVKYHGVEADDIAAWIVKNRLDYGIDQVWLISSDRDWDLLLAEDVKRFSYVTRKESTLDNWSESYDFPHSQYITFKCLDGDKGDNVPGIPGIGPKRASSLIEQFGDVFEIYDQCPMPGTQKFIQNLNSNYEQLLTNVELMDLLTYCDEAIGEENIIDLRSKLKELMNV